MCFVYGSNLSSNSGQRLVLKNGSDPTPTTIGVPGL
jgi:hypothetical protein